MKVSARFKPYPEYKDSGVEWLGKIPEEWAKLRLKNVISSPVTDGPHETPDFISEGVPFLSVDGIQNGELVFEGCRYISKDAHHIYRKKVNPKKDDLLLGKAASTGKIARIKVDFEFSIWSPLALIRPDNKVSNPVFLEYSLKSQNTQSQIDILCTTNTQNNIAMRDIPEIWVCTPKLSEQQLIAHFLEEKNKQIGLLILEQETAIELLKEKRSALITQAVTKGLDPNVPMKDSGIEWLGEIPEHWNIKKVKYLLADGKEGMKIGPFGSQLKSEILKKKGKKVYGQENVINDDFKLGHRCIDDIKFQELSVYEIKPGDILITMMGTSGLCKIVPDDIEQGIMDSHLLRMRTNRMRLIPELFPLLIEHSNYIQNQISFLGKGAIMHGLNSGIVKSLIIAQPPLSEQKKILAHLKKILHSFSMTTNSIIENIDHLKEYRSALISAAVTGKIDVRGMA